MPLNTQIIRNGEPILLRWGDFHVCAMALAASFDDGSRDVNDIYDTPDIPDLECYPDAAFPITRQLAFMFTSYPMLARTPLNDGHYTLTKRHKFRDVTDGEILELLPGDELVAYRGW